MSLTISNNLLGAIHERALAAITKMARAQMMQLHTFTNTA